MSAIDTERLCSDLANVMSQRDGLVAERDELRREVARLRAQNKAHAERRDREQAEMESRLSRFTNHIDDARKRMEHAAVDWTTDPPSQRPGGWWHYTSMNNLNEVVALVGELQATREERDRYRSALQHLADRDSWLGDPESHVAALHGHFTPFELAREALKEPCDHGDG